MNFFDVSISFITIKYFIYIPMETSWWAKHSSGVKPASIYLQGPTKINSSFHIILRKPISSTCYDLVQSDNSARLQQF